MPTPNARSAHAQRAQVGQEAISGQAVPATKALSSGSLTITPKVTTERIRPAGNDFDSLVYEKDSRSTGKFEGIPSFTELKDLLTVTYGRPTTTPSEDEVVYKHEFVLGDRPTWTVEYGEVGQDGDAFRATGVMVKEAQFEFTSSGDSKMSLDLEGGAVVDGQTLTPAAEEVTARPLLAKNMTVYVDASLANIGKTELDGTLKSEVKLGSIADLVRFFGSSAAVRTAPDATVKLVSIADVAGRAFLNGIKTSRVHYIRVEVTGADIADAANATAEVLRFDFAAQCEEHDRGEEEAVYCATNTFRVVQDASGFSHRVTLVTDQP